MIEKKKGIQCWKENREQMRMRGKTKTLGEREREGGKRDVGVGKKKEGRKEVRFFWAVVRM